MVVLINLVFSEEGKEEILKVTFEELRQSVALYAAAMRKMGVKVGDRVVGKFFFLFVFLKGEEVTFS